MLTKGGQAKCVENGTVPGQTESARFEERSPTKTVWLRPSVTLARLVLLLRYRTPFGSSVTGQLHQRVLLPTLATKFDRPKTTRVLSLMSTTFTVSLKAGLPPP